MGPGGTRRAAGVAAVAVACAAWTALTPSAPRAADGGGPAPPSRSWHLSSVTVGLEDSFLGVPRTRLNDDNGFVADLRAAAELTDRDRRTARLVARQQLITERGGLRRVDDGRVYLEWRRAPPGLRGLTVGWLAGIDLVGDLGGAGLQDWAHRRLFSGRVLGGEGALRLQDRYPARTEVLGLLGGHVRGVQPLQGPLSLRGGLDVTLGAGTGFFAEVHPYVAAGVTLGFVDLELRAGAGSYWTSIPALTIPGGYVTSILQFQPSARLVLHGPAWLPVIFGLELDWNSGNTSQRVGGVVVGVKL